MAITFWPRRLARTHAPQRFASTFRHYHGRSYRHDRLATIKSACAGWHRTSPMLPGTNSGFTRVYLSRNYAWTSYGNSIGFATCTATTLYGRKPYTDPGFAVADDGAQQGAKCPPAAQGTYKAPSYYQGVGLAVPSVVFLTDSCKVLRRAAFLVLVGPELSKEADAMGLALGATGEWLAVGSTIQVWEFCIVPPAPRHCLINRF